MPYGVYDVGANEGLMMLTTSDDTAELACDAVRSWWYRLGKWRYAAYDRPLPGALSHHVR